MKLTRHMRTARLINRLCEGPSLSYATFGVDGVDLNKAQRALVAMQVERDMRIWLDSWIKPDVIALVPELKGART